MKPTLSVRHASDIYIGDATALLPVLLPAGRVVVITDAAVDRCHAALTAPYEKILIGRGEACKTLQTVEQIHRRLIELGADRHTFVLAVGGGIVTDTAGFAAATYMRGVPFGFVSTTLLGQVDASVGGKNGVNVGGYKNMAGSFMQPRFVVCDPSLLATLPEREFRAGLAEAVKAAVIGDAPLFGRLEGATFETLRSDAALLGAVVEGAIRVKAAIVERDERETGDRRLLNLGHTLAHAIEKCSDRMNHGEAVAVGLHLIAAAAVRRGLLDAAEGARIGMLLGRLGFDLRPPVSVERLLAEVGKDKKSEGSQLHVVVPRAIGRCEVCTVAKQELGSWLL